MPANTAQFVLMVDLTGDDTRDQARIRLALLFSEEQIAAVGVGPFRAMGHQIHAGKGRTRIGRFSINAE